MTAPLRVTGTFLPLLLAVVLAAPVRAADLNVLPRDAELVLVVQWKQILNSELVKAEKDALKSILSSVQRITADTPIVQCLQESGFDAMRDLDSVAVVLKVGKKPEPTLVVIEGKFHSAKLNAGGMKIFELVTRQDPKWHASLLDGKTLVAAATKDALEGILARKDGSKEDEFRKGFKPLLDAVTGKQSVAMVATGAALSTLMERTELANADAAAGALKALDAGALAVTITKDIRVELSLHARDDASAKKIADAGKSAVQSLRRITLQNAKKDGKLIPMADVIKTMTIASQGPNVILRVEASLDAIERLMKSFPVK